MSTTPNQYAQELGLNKVPEHVGIIMDGNGRWAQNRGMPRPMGHRAGVEALREIIRLSSDLGIKVLSLYAFSTENWKRPAEEVGLLMRLLIEFLYKEIEELNKNRVRITFMGDIEAFPKDVYEAICYGIEKTVHNDGLVVNIALNYGGRAELVRAVRALAQKTAAGELTAEQIDETVIASQLYTAGLPDPDVIIRTSGEMRMSNFMLWQASYAELCFPKVLWPDFDRKAYLEVLKGYQQRERRYGGLQEKVK